MNNRITWSLTVGGVWSTSYTILPAESDFITFGTVSKVSPDVTDLDEN